jgi:hypothetical protein
MIYERENNIEISTIVSALRVIPLQDA